MSDGTPGGGAGAVVARARARLAPHPASVGEARRLVRALLRDHGRDDLLDAAELLVTEVVTNALVHAGTPVEVRAVLGPDGLRVEVGDGSPQLPAVRRNATLAGTGRGLRLLQHLVDRWGAQPDQRGPGKTVWFELSRGDREDEWLGLDLGDGLDEEGLAALASAGSGPGEAPSEVQVELLNMPLLLHVAWHQHAEALLREHLLHELGQEMDPDSVEDGDEALGLEPDVDQLQAHATASEALALMVAHVRDPGLTDDPDELLASAEDPDVSSPRELLPVPVEALPAFRVLDRVLDAALTLADEGVFLTPPTQPEIRAFRRWVCDEVSRQSAGEEARPWAEQVDDEPVPDYDGVQWAADHVAGAEDALIAADDANGILAVSRAALAILGYDSPEQLVGRRLVAIIPNRLRQAHLAGFTMHLANGRSPLLGRRVTVPALRRDGSETPVALTVESQSLPTGRRVFVASLAAA